MRVSVRVINSQSIKKPAMMWLAVDKVIMLILTPEAADSYSGSGRSLLRKRQIVGRVVDAGEGERLVAFHACAAAAAMTLAALVA